MQRDRLIEAVGRVILRYGLVLFLIAFGLLIATRRWLPTLSGVGSLGAALWSAGDALQARIG